VLETLGRVCGFDAETSKRGLTPDERLAFHKQHSGPVMQDLESWLKAQLAEKKTEPNSGLGKAIAYLLNHWKGLTAFLREVNAPLDNNPVERALKRVTSRKESTWWFPAIHITAMMCPSITAVPPMAGSPARGRREALIVKSRLWRTEAISACHCGKNLPAFGTLTFLENGPELIRTIKDKDKPKSCITVGF
jgi:hypothetical protein